MLMDLYVIFVLVQLKKYFSKQKSVAGIKVNLENMLITINFKENQKLSYEKITEMIKDSGYDVREIKNVK